MRPFHPKVDHRLAVATRQRLQEAILNLAKEHPELREPMLAMIHNAEAGATIREGFRLADVYQETGREFLRRLCR